MASTTVAASAKVATRARWRALGTSAEMVVSDGEALERARSIVERELERIDRACSRFREDSDLTRVNAQAGRTIQVSPLLIEATELALRAAELTDGDVDPTIGVAIELAGYDRDWRLLARPPAERRSDVPSGAPTAVEAPRTGLGPHEDRPKGEDALRVIATVRAGWERVELDRERATLKIPRGVKLDLGATAKAWAADRASGAVHEETGCGVLVSLGGDISTAGDAPRGGWSIHVTDDHRGGPDAPGQRISIASGGLATSSTTVRRWRHEGRTMHHIIDPTTGEPVASPWRTVSVAAADCADANIAATAAIVRGERAPRWLAELGLPARLVARNGEVVTVGQWPREVRS
ncbi:MAG: FAD:protein FMN transferase [Solirubrobacteraceae bacterium]